MLALSTEARRAGIAKGMVVRQALRAFVPDNRHAIFAAILLISNTIRVAAFSRRRETGIMRLVGASNLYIQLPFLLEGVLVGVEDGAAPAARVGRWPGWDQ